MEEEEVTQAGFGKTIEFSLMIRNKSNINIKHFSQQSHLILESRLPTVYDESYSSSRVRVSDEKYIKEVLQTDLKILRNNFSEKKRAKEDELLPFVTEAIDYCEAQLAKKDSEVAQDDEDDEPSFVSLQEQNRAKMQ